MDITNRNRLRYNSKVNEIRCIRCGDKILARRNDAKTCSTLCRVQEGLDRKEKGYIHRVFKGDEKDLEELLNCIKKSAAYFMFSDCIIEIQEELKINDNSQSWKIDGVGYRFVYFPNIKKKPFELYINESKHCIWNLLLKPTKLVKPQC